MEGGALDRASILELVNAPQPLVEGYLDLGAQLQPNGFDLTLGEVREMTSPGELGPDPNPSVLPASRSLDFDPDGYLALPPGPYLITVNEVVNLPLDVMALARPRSSLLRSGVAIHTAVWDAGYRGRSQSLLAVYNSHGYRVARNARLLQMVFFRLARPLPAKEGYAGRFMGENI